MAEEKGPFVSARRDGKWLTNWLACKHSGKHRRKPKVPQPLGLRDSRFVLAVWTRLELATPCVTGMYSNQLNYQTLSFDTLRRLPVVGGANIRSLLTMVASRVHIFRQLCLSKGIFIRSLRVNTLSSSVPKGHSRASKTSSFDPGARSQDPLRNTLPSSVAT